MRDVTLTAAGKNHKAGLDAEERLYINESCILGEGTRTVRVGPIPRDGTPPKGDLCEVCWPAPVKSAK